MQVRFFTRVKVANTCRSSFTPESNRQTKVKFYDTVKNINTDPVLCQSKKGRHRSVLHQTQNVRPRSSFILESKRLSKILLYTSQITLTLLFYNSVKMQKVIPFCISLKKLDKGQILYQRKNINTRTDLHESQIGRHYSGFKIVPKM